MMNGAASLALIASFAAAAAPVMRPAETPAPIKTSIAKVTFEAAASEPRWVAAALPAAAKWTPLPRHRSKGRVVVGALIGGAAGFMAGGYIGYGIQYKLSDGRCYDVCFKGLLIGAPIGAVAGAIAGAAIAR